MNDQELAAEARRVARALLNVLSSNDRDRLAAELLRQLADRLDALTRRDGDMADHMSPHLEGGECVCTCPRCTDPDTHQCICPECRGHDS